jgi:nitrilase
MKIAALQMVSGQDVAANLAQARSLMQQAAARARSWWCCPSISVPWEPGTPTSWPTGGVWPGADPGLHGRCRRQLQLWVVAGTLPLQAADDSHVLNTSLVYSPDGECVARYDKIHLFQFDNGRESYTEAAVVQAGSQPVVCDIQANGELAPGPERLLRPSLSRAVPRAQRAGADLLLVPSAFTYTTGQAHWEVLLRARAIENLAYVLAPGQGGVHENGRRTWGHSLLIDPWGEVQGLQASGAGVVAESSIVTACCRCASNCRP